MKLLVLSYIAGGNENGETTWGNKVCAISYKIAHTLKLDLAFTFLSPIKINVYSKTCI